MKKCLFILLISILFGCSNVFAAPRAEMSAGRSAGGIGVSGMHGGVHIHHGGMPPGAFVHRPPMGPPPMRYYYHRAVNPVFVRVQYVSPYYCDPYNPDYYDPYYCPRPPRPMRHRVPNNGYSVIYYE